MTSSDVIIIGGGHNGLVCAALLAKSGRKVLVLEADRETGGAGRTVEFAPGFRAPFAHVLNRLHPHVTAALDLQRHGLKFSPPARTTVLSEVDAPLVLHGGYGERLEGASATEAAAWASLRAQLLRYAGILKPLLARTPPKLTGLSLGEAAGLAQTGLSLRRLGREDMRDFLRMLLMNVTDVLDEHLTDDRLRGLLAFDAVMGSHLGPRSPTSLLGLYYRFAGEMDGMSGAQMVDTSSAIEAIRKAATSLGVSIRTESTVKHIALTSGRATGVVLASGEALSANLVVSAINPRATFLNLVGARDLDTGFVRKVGNIRMKGNVAKLHLALSTLPRFTGVDASLLNGRLVVAPSDTHVENAFNPAKYGQFSSEPVMEITLPSIADPSLAPTDSCVLSANVQFAPYALREGWEAGKPKFLDAILKQLERHAPGIGASILHADVMTPADIEARFHMPGGHWHHGEMQPDQMFVSRPVSGWSGYATPIDDLWLCSSGSHPGGGISGVPGMNAARAILGRKR